MKTLIANVVHFIHLLVICFILVVPFSNNVCLLFLYVLSAGCILIHWVSNQDVCCLTELEKFLRGKKENQSDEPDNKYFMEKLISPVYKFPQMHESISSISYIVVIVFMFVALSKLIYRMTTEKLHWIDLFIL